MSRAGQHAEDVAAAYLQRHGLKVIARNYRCRFGEIDLIAEDRGSLVFIEVRLRTRSDFGGAAESIDAAKRRRLVAAARHYLARTGADRACRFDAFLVTGNDGAVEWLKNVICE
jgi:putative endonuclease